MDALQIKMPFTMKAPDYHDFDQVKFYLSQISGSQVAFRELDPGTEVENAVGYGPYVAEFYRV